jgi:hypothetical protein
VNLRKLAPRLPAPDDLERISLALAALEVILSPDPRFRFFAFEPEWRPAAKLASMNNGSGDDYGIVFTQHGTVVRGFDHESELSPWARPDQKVDPALLVGYPANLQWIIDDAAFRLEGGPETNLTFCFWRVDAAASWNCGSVEDVGTPPHITWNWSSMAHRRATERSRAIITSAI